MVLGGSASIGSAIARVARKGVRTEIQALKKASAAYRTEIAALKRRAQALEQEVRRLNKGSTKAKVAQPEEAEELPLDSVPSAWRPRGAGLN